MSRDERTRHEGKVDTVRENWRSEKKGRSEEGRRT
jgi:hypothetical protein